MFFLKLFEVVLYTIDWRLCSYCKVFCTHREKETLYIAPQKRVCGNSLNNFFGHKLNHTSDLSKFESNRDKLIYLFQSKIEDLKLLNDSYFENFKKENGL